MSQNKEYALLCLENPLLDIQGKGDEALLQKYGLKANDAILAEEKHMDLYEDLLQNHDAKLIAGGSAQNTARGAQYMLPPDSVVYLGCVGADKYADLLREKNAEAGLRSEYRVDATQPTGRCGVIITDQNRSMATHLAAANEYKLEHLQSPEVWPLAQKARVFYVGGYHLTVCVPAVLALAAEAARENKVFAMGMGAPFVPTVFREPLDRCAPYWDYVLMNETEAVAWAGGRGFGEAEEKDVKGIAKRIAELEKANPRRKRVVVVTQGTEETIVAIQGQEALKTFPVHEIGKEQICDTNGAGDAFAGGFLSGIVEGTSLEEAVDRGQWLAALGLKELGPSYPMPKQTHKKQ